MKNLTRNQKISFTLVFALLGFALLQIPVIELAGSNAKLTLFEFFGPIATGFIGLGPGLIAIAFMEAIDFLANGSQITDIGTIIHFFPMLAAGLYFGRKSFVTGIVIPIVAIALFVSHDIGRTVWYYSLFWLIPIACHFAREKSLLARSLGATFTAHAVGGAAWIYAFALPKSVWISLIPVVIVERLTFALGIAGVYIIASNALQILANKEIIPRISQPKYVWNKLLKI